MKRAKRLLIVLLIALCVQLPLIAAPAMAGQATPQSQAQPASSAEQQLADLYVPVAYLREQEYQCAIPPGGGEPYLPLPVEIVLDNPEVLIRDGANNDQVLATGVGAAELATFGPDTYMDFPGDPRRPGCTYETHERARIADLGLEPTTYVHVIFDDTEQRLALQYWFFWYFNDWNNTHESDWEMIQVMWDDVASVDQALQQPPTRIGYSQHGNGELADWGDAKVKLEDGTHPLVYPAAGSHATFFSNDTFLAWGERSSGFGCDVSSPPSVRTPLQAVVVPNDPDPDGEFAWLLYEGRWGERQPGSFNGPLGASFNSRWIEPWETTDNWRDFSIVVPEVNNALGPTMTDTFCSLTEAGSKVLIYAIVYPWLILPAVAIAIGILGFFYVRSRSVFQRARVMYQNHWRVFVGIGLLAIPIGIVFNIVQAFLTGRYPLEWVVQWFDNTAGAELTTVYAIGGVQQIAMVFAIAPAIIQAVIDIRNGEQPGIMRSFRIASTRILAIGGALVLLLVLAGIPLLTVIGLPIAIWLVVRWHFFVQALMFNKETGSAESLRESARMVKGRWWKTFFAVFIFDLLATIPGIVVGFGLLTLGRTGVGLANSVSSVLYSLLIPLSVVAVTLLYIDRRESGAAEGTPGD